MIWRAEQPLDLAPLSVGVDAGADAAHLDPVGLYSTIGKALDLDRVGPAGRKRRQALAAVAAVCRLHHGDRSNSLIPSHGFAHEQIGVRLQEATGAELKDRERAHGVISR
jgi:hypothetical protein